VSVTELADQMANNAMEKGSIRAVQRSRAGAGFSASSVALYVGKLILSEAYFSRRVSHMSNDIVEATKKVESMTAALKANIDEMVEQENRLEKAAKSVSGSVRSSVEKLGQGITRIEKTANFAQLEQMVSLLERANTALTSLAELEKAGSLNRISEAIK